MTKVHRPEGAIRHETREEHQPEGELGGDDRLGGDGMLSPTVARTLISLVAGDPEADARSRHAREGLATLTDREREVALAVGRGLPNDEIAADLFMSVATVKAHVSRLLAKLGVDNRVQIALLVQAGER